MNGWRKRVSVACVAAGLAAASSPAFGTSSEPHVIRPGVSIGKIRLGMTVPQVRRVLGRPFAVIRRANSGFGLRYVEYQWEFGNWRVGFRGRAGDERAVRIGTTLRSQRTPQGVGVGSDVRQIARRYRGRVSCLSRGSPDAGTWLVLRGPGRAMTAFVLIKANGPKERHLPPSVGEVVVQRAWASGGNTPCAADWPTWRW